MPLHPFALAQVVAHAAALQLLAEQHDLEVAVSVGPSGSAVVFTGDRQPHPTDASTLAEISGVSIDTTIPPLYQ